MTDTPIEPTAPSPLDLDQSQVSAMREHWIATGFDPADFDRALTETPDAAPAAAEAVEIMSDLKQPTLTPAQAEDLAAEMVRAGIPEDKVREALEADGYTVAPDERTDDEKEFDRAFAAGKPGDYHLDFMGRVPADMDLAQVAKANAEMTGWLAEVGFPPEIGPGVMERAIDVGQQYGRMDDVSRELWRREQDYQFDKLARSDERACELLEQALAVLERGSPNFRVMLAKSGALHDAGFLMHLAHQGERLAARSAL